MPARSERTRLGEPLAVERQIRPCTDEIEVPIVMKDPKLVTIGNGRLQNVDRRHAMVSDPCQLPLRVDCASLDHLIDSGPR